MNVCVHVVYTRASRTTEGTHTLYNKIYINMYLLTLEYFRNLERQHRKMSCHDMFKTQSNDLINVGTNST